MRGRLRCKLFGHDFRTLEIEKVFGGLHGVWRASNGCRHCGLTRKEAGL